MPLFERARIEVYLPDLPRRAYQDLLESLELEFTRTFGGCSVIRGVEGSYLSDAGEIIGDRVNVLYTDADLPFESNLDIVHRYAEQLEASASQALDEECVLVVVYKVHHYRRQAGS